jgi:eukaryotic-like serine/threonine-protein kinase
VPPRERIGRYRIDGRLGSGAFASVWLGYDEALEAPVAVKLLADNWSHDPDIRSRFLQEARILRRIDSDRLVRVYDLGQTDDERPYFVMACADRGTLAERLKRGPLPVDEALHVSVEVARAVAVLHDAEVIHRDIKPSNVLFHSTRSGERILIADLGVAKAAAQASGFTIGAGTPGYMAPEQGKPGVKIDVRVDVYGLGALAYHLLSGGVRHDQADGKPPSAHRDGVPTEADAVVMRALAEDREQRWPDAGTFAMALAAVSVPRAAPEPVTQPIPLADGSSPAPERHTVIGRLSPRGRRRVFLVTAFVLVAVLGAGAALLWYPWPSPETVLVTHKTGALSLEVPVEWAGERQDARTWDPALVQLADQDTGQQPAVEVSPDLDTWRNIDTTTPGVFAGFRTGAEHEPAPEQADVHMTCVAPTTERVTVGERQAVVARRTSCPGKWTLTEIDLRDEADDFSVYLQIKQPDGVDWAPRILRTVQVHPERLG